MHILELCLRAADLAALDQFYAGTLGLPSVRHERSGLAFQVGRSQLMFVQDESFRGRYHVAFDVPNNQLDQARAWLETRVPLLQARNGSTIFHTDDWNADQFYFLDPAGNILELIARHTANTTANTPFSSKSLLAITEIGLATSDVPTTVAWFQAALGLDPYRSHSSTFTPVGSETGLFIIVQHEREWFPNTGVQAVPLPVEVVLEGERLGEFTVPGLPYHMRVQPHQTS
ncbi:MAG: hypothetical protein MUD01_16255 [Chloroflexaceae bacterium]|jgi:catechol-2,3-dioxygenase|nr:hypothetical protein [Chloroflexaceae bacterium]